MDDRDQRAQEDDEIYKLLNPHEQDDEERERIEAFLDINRPLDLGEKADDAEDFSDIDDDDLPEEEEHSGGLSADGPGLTDDGGTSAEAEEEDLFGDGDALFDERMSSPVDERDGLDGVMIRNGEPQPMSGLTLPTVDDASTDYRNINFDQPKSWGQGNQDLSIPAPAESQEDFLKQCWPTFEKGKIIQWNELLPPKKAHHVPKRPEKAVKPVHPTKVSLDPAADQEKQFRIAGPAQSSTHQRVAEARARGYVAIVEESSEEQSDAADAIDFRTPDPDEMIGNVSMMDLELICDDWEARFSAINQDEGTDEETEEPVDREEAEWRRAIQYQPKKRKRADIEILNVPTFSVPSFDDFEQVTAHVSKQVILDLNDPQLLIDAQAVDTRAKRRRIGDAFSRGENGDLSKALHRRFNISNDEAYDALKENHQSKVRAIIGNISIEHSMPAKKLQWPYYRVKLSIKEARTYHRPQLKFAKWKGSLIALEKPTIRKKKNLKGLSIEQIYQTSADLSLGDNSTAMLLEYSEEFPTVLSNFGMGNKIINYYRRKDPEDAYRPKLEIGEASVLLPEDRSPFAQFGSVAAGETVPTLFNSMYRAPVFKHEVQSTDFLMLRSTTGVDGTKFYLRNVDHVFVVGQQLPSVEVPGPQSRKYTNAAKNRMKMIAFRKIRHSPQQTVRIDEITSHIQDSSDMQNRQKLKEFIKYHKDEKVWRVKPGESVPDEATVRAWVKPEDICTIDAMQVGLRHLEDAGYGKEDHGDDDEEHEDEDKEGDSLEEKLAPWKTTKNFLDASAGKAMLALHGEGDPSGRGLAFSFIKTSMKGGYLEVAKGGPQMTSADHIEAERKANGGHRYNVEKQNEAYNVAIQDIWQKQRDNLSSAQEVDDDEEMEHPLEVEDGYGVAATAAATPARFDDSASMFSRLSTNSKQQQGKKLRIVRKVKNKFGGIDEVSEVIRDPRIWREYLKRRHALDSDKVDVYKIQSTGIAEYDKKEIAR